MHIGNYYKVGYLEGGDMQTPPKHFGNYNRRGFVYRNDIWLCSSFYEIGDFSLKQSRYRPGVAQRVPGS